MSNERDEATRRRSAETEYRDRLRLRENLRVLLRFGRAYVRLLKRHLERTEQELGYLNGVGYIVGHVLSSTHSERFAVETKVGFRYLVGCDSKLDKKKITEGTRVFMEENTLTIMGILPRQVESEVHNMIVEDPVKVSYAALGGLSDQIRELRESIELPLMNPEIFQKVGIRPPKAVLLYGPPGTGKTLLARAIASNVDAKFLNIITSTLSVKFPGEGSDLIRRIFSYARDNQPCIIFMDEIDGICARRLEEGTAGDREIRRTLTELLHQMDECNGLEKVKVIMATNRRDVLDPALLRAGRFDRQIEIPLPNNHSRMQILQIYAAEIAKQGEIDYEAVVKLSEGFNGADLRNVCTEAGMLAIRANRDYAINIDFMKAVRKLIEAKQLESTIH
ncbi:hypothetical protein PHAVU_009G005000 [Phaseolus vulgaris]|uniref:AAA+ ATPase domain-containing protein n=1 Tax=Phaseolus vulgaris TaxID=3885 RepID=V7ATK7_PHAVU|nr:hypothetical protein PHAVU_009G005000g [Phaseolus vulgaris]ESW07938.1 hypothetical protein PHAVU_009G005000g [Phaseolus vulgaris]